MSLKETQGLKVVPVRFSKTISSCHNFYMKEHSLRFQEENKPQGRTLFILNVPPYITKKCLKSLFSSLGSVNSVLFEDNINKDYYTCEGFKAAFVVFSKREDLLKVLQITSLSLDKLPLHMGLDKWVQEYNESVNDSQQLTKEINNFMSKYDRSEEHKKKDKSKEVDDDGWTVVTKKGNNPGISRKESVNLKLIEKIKTGFKKKELKNFYTFQIRENKMKNLIQLRKNYEEAKNKVALMKSSRRFKPC